MALRAAFGATGVLLLACGPAQVVLAPRGELRVGRAHPSAALEHCPAQQSALPVHHGVLDAPLPSSVATALLDHGTAYLGRADGWIEIWSTSGPSLVTRWRASERAIRSIAVGVDGSVLVASGETEARLWNTEDPSLAHRIELDGARIDVVAASVGAQVFALGADDGEVGVWRSDRRLARYRVHGAVHALALSADGRRIAVGNARGDVSVFGGRVEKTFHVADSAVATLTFARDRTRLFAAATDGSVVYYDVRIGREERRIAGCAWTTLSATLDGTGSHAIPCEGSAVARGSTYAGIAFASGGRDVILAGPGAIMLRDPERPFEGGTTASFWVGSGAYSSIAGDSKRREAMACRSLGACEVVDLESSNFGPRFGGLGGDPITDVAFDAATRRLAIVAQSSTSVWMLPCGSATRRLDFNYRSASAAFLQDRLVSWSFGPGFALQDLRPSFEIVDRNGVARSLRASNRIPGILTAARDAPRFAFGTGIDRIDLADPRDARVIGSTDGWCASDPRCPDGIGELRDLRLSDDGRILVAASGGGSSDWLHCLAGPECGRRGFTVAAWMLSLPTRGQERASARHLWSHYGPPANAIDLSADDKSVVAGGSDGLTTIYDLANGRELITLPHERPITAVAFSADRRHLLTGDDDGMVRIYDLAALPEVHELRAHAGHVSRIRALPNGFALSSSVDGSVAIIRIRDAVVTGRLTLLADRQWIVQSADGSVEASDGARDVFEFRPAKVDGPRARGHDHFDEFSVPGLLGRLLDAG